MNAGVRISCSWSLCLDLVPLKQALAAVYCIFLIGQPYPRSGCKLQMTFIEGLQVTSFLLRSEAAKNVHFVLNQTCAVAISFLRSHTPKLSLSSSWCCSWELLPIMNRVLNIWYYKVYITYCHLNSGCWARSYSSHKVSQSRSQNSKLVDRP